MPVTKVIPSYLYTEYNDDDNLQAFVSSQNQLAQNYLNTFNDLNLPIYTSGIISGALLDWVGAGLYGMPRPVLPSSGTPSRGPIDTFTIGTLTYDVWVPAQGTEFFSTSDDIYKRILTWHFYKGDGKLFDITWLKRRIQRFLTGINGTDPGVDQTYFVSVVFTGPYALTITLIDSPVSEIWVKGVESGKIEMPFQFTYTISLVDESSFGHFAFGIGAFGT